MVKSTDKEWLETELYGIWKFYGRGMEIKECVSTVMLCIVIVYILPGEFTL